jgi:hypothetical protein
MNGMRRQIVRFNGVRLARGRPEALLAELLPFLQRKS